MAEQVVTQESSEEAMLSRIEAKIFGQEEPSDETQETQQSTEQVETQEPPVEEKTEEVPPEFYEFEWNGGKYQVPPELKELHEGYLRQSDYTKKTQEAADARRSADAILQQAQAAAALRDAAKPQKEQLAALNAALRQFQSIDWNKLTAEDPFEAQKQFMAQSQIKDSIERLTGEISKEEADHQAKLQAALAKVAEESNKTLSREIKGWGQDRWLALNKFAQEAYGFTQRETADVIDARVVKMMNDAYEWRQLQASKPQIANKAAQASKTLKPNASEGSKAGQQDAEYRKALRSAKTDHDKARVIQQRIESRIA